MTKCSSDNLASKYQHSATSLLSTVLNKRYASSLSGKGVRWCFGTTTLSQITAVMRLNAHFIGRCLSFCGRKTADDMIEMNFGRSEVCKTTTTSRISATLKNPIPPFNLLPGCQGDRFHPRRRRFGSGLYSERLESNIQRRTGVVSYGIQTSHKHRDFN